MGHIFDEFEVLNDKTAIVCALEQHKGTRDLISGAYEDYLTGFCLSLSVICLILHVAIYCALPKLWNLPGKNLLSLSWALLFAQFIFLVGVNPVFEVPLGMCIGIAAVDYFCFLAAFFWMNVMSVDIWRTFSGSTFRGSDGQRTHRKYAVYAWGASVFLALGALIVDLCTEDGAVTPSFGMGQVIVSCSRRSLPPTLFSLFKLVLRQFKSANSKLIFINFFLVSPQNVAFLSGQCFQVLPPFRQYRLS
jgi:hypothetical protein